MSAAPRLLDGLRVLELGEGVAVAQCGKLLAEAGATVTLLEPPAGGALRRMPPFAKDAVSLLATVLHAGKRGLALDLVANPAPLERLIAQADVVIAAPGPGVPDATDLFALAGGEAGGRVVTAITPFGSDGPSAADAGSDLVIAATGGFLHMIGTQDGGPLTLGSFQAERSAGAAGFTGTMVALQGGRGALVDVSAQETIAFMEWKADIYTQSDGKPRLRGAPSQWFELRCRDGFLGFVYENGEWPRILKLVDDPRIASERFATRDDRLARHAELTALMQEWAGQRSKAEAYHEAQRLGVPVGMVATVADLYDSAQYREAGFFQRIEQPGLGSLEMPGASWMIDGNRPDLTPGPEAPHG